MLHNVPYTYTGFQTYKKSSIFLCSKGALPHKGDVMQVEWSVKKAIIGAKGNNMSMLL